MILLQCPLPSSDEAITVICRARALALIEKRSRCRIISFVTLFSPYLRSKSAIKCTMENLTRQRQRDETHDIDVVYTMKATRRSCLLTMQNMGIIHGH